MFYEIEFEVHCDMIFVIINERFLSSSSLDSNKRTNYLVRQLRQQTGKQHVNCDNWHKENNSMLRVLCEDNEAFRDTIQTKKIRISRYLPMNSLKGMRLLFRVSNKCCPVLFFFDVLFCAL